MVDDEYSLVPSNTGDLVAASGVHQLLAVPYAADRTCINGIADFQPAKPVIAQFSGSSPKMYA